MPMLSRSEAEDILYREARILDERRYNDWAAMLTNDMIYWLPCNGEGRDPNRHISLVYDDRARLSDRIERLGSGVAHSQNPASKTRRMVANVEVEQSAENEASVFSNFMIYELRRGREHVYAGRCEHRMRYDGGCWKIAHKKAVLVNNDEVIDNLTFLV